MYSHNHKRTTKGVFFFLPFVQKSPVRGKCLCFQILLYNFHNVYSLVVCEEYQGKSVFDSKDTYLK